MIKSSAHITSKNPMATIQDKGRSGYRNFGIAGSGPMDAFSYKVANALIDNDENDAVIEVYNSPFSIKFEEDCLIAVTGIDAVVLINNVIIQDARTIAIYAGDELFLPYSQSGFWKYIAIKGGWQSPVVLGSRSSNFGLGMLKIATNTILPYLSYSHHSAARHATFQTLKRPIKILPGPESQLFDQAKLASALTNEFTLDSQSNRMAYSFKERIYLPEAIVSINSAAVFPGIVQLTPSGIFFILMRDCQTTGGYPRIGYLREDDLLILSQIKINGTVQFHYHLSG